MAPTKNSQVLRRLLSSIQRYLNTENYSVTFTDVVFKTTDNGYPQSKTKETKASGLGNKPRTLDSLKDEEVEKHFLAKFDLYIWAKQTK